MKRDISGPLRRDFRYLLSIFIRASPGNSVRFSDLQWDAQLKFLVASGFITQKSDGTYEIISPLIQSLAMVTIQSEDRRAPPKMPFPVTYDQRVIDIPALICGAISAFQRKYFLDSIQISSKLYPAIAGLKSFDQKEVPCEAVYHSELYSVIHSWMESPGVGLFTNVAVTEPGKKQKRCDLLLVRQNWKCALEIVVHDTQDSLQLHLDKTVVYKQQLQAAVAYVIHFTLIPDCAEYRYPYGNDQVSFIHVQHDSELKCWCVHFPRMDCASKVYWEKKTVEIP